jgi:nitrous oxidase accessory protein NosD
MRRIRGLAGATIVLLSLAFAPTVRGATTAVDCRGGADLQAAIDAATPGDTILVSGTCIGNFTIDRSLVIAGGGGSATLDGGGVGATVSIGSGPDLDIDLIGLTVTGGAPGILLQHPDHLNLTIGDASLGGNPGGGLFLNEGFGSLVTVRDSTVRGNAGFGLHDHGSPSALVLEGTLVRDTAGDGVIADFDSNLDVLDSEIRGSTGAGIRFDSASVLVEDSTIRGNAGGGIVSGTQRLFLLIARSRIVDNTSPGDGGGISTINDGPASFQMRDSTVANNRAAGRGGGLLLTGANESTLTNVVFRNNRAGLEGGGMYLAGPGPVTRMNVTFHHNTPQDCVGC